MLIKLGARGKESLGDHDGVFMHYYGVETVTNDESSKLTNEKLFERHRFFRNWMDSFLKGGDRMETEGQELDPAGGETPENGGTDEGTDTSGNGSDTETDAE